MYGHSVMAACMPGLPCVVNKTPNDPTNATDGPNAPGAPNVSKIDKSACTGNKSLNCACDADFMNQIYSRAFLESQRETLTNEVLIRKPDSVFEYTCFDREIGRTGSVAGPIFSESTRWRSSSIPLGPGIGGFYGTTSVGDNTITKSDISVYMGAGRLSANINRIITPAIGSWVSGNFAHNFLGGGITANITAGPGCDIMDQVYFYAKCMNFAPDVPYFSYLPTSDPKIWSSLKTLVDTDPRLLPTACKGGTKITEDMIFLSKNRNFDHVNFDKDDPIYLDRRIPGTCADPIPTGIIVRTFVKNFTGSGAVTFSNSDSYESKICPNPGCYYQRSGDQCVP